jgi:hypothetical protein
MTGLDTQVAGLQRWARHAGPAELLRPHAHTARLITSLSSEHRSALAAAQRPCLASSGTHTHTAAARRRWQVYSRHPAPTCMWPLVQRERWRNTLRASSGASPTARYSARYLHQRARRTQHCCPAAAPANCNLPGVQGTCNVKSCNTKCSLLLLYALPLGTVRPEPAAGRTGTTAPGSHHTRQPPHQTGGAGSAARKLLTPATHLPVKPRFLSSIDSA